MQQPLYFLPQTPAGQMFQTIHFSSNIVQQQSILATMNIQKSPTLLLLNTTKQVCWAPISAATLQSSSN